MNQEAFNPFLGGKSGSGLRQGLEASYIHESLESLDTINGIPAARDPFPRPFSRDFVGHPHTETHTRARQDVG